MSKEIEARTLTMPYAPEEATKVWITEEGKWLSKGSDGYRLTSQAPGVLVYTREYRPSWLLIPCVLLFPIGLLALVHKERDTLTLRFDRGTDAETTIVRAEGSGPKALGRLLDETRAHYLQSSAIGCRDAQQQAAPISAHRR
jgi:hypothetical protein